MTIFGKRLRDYFLFVRFGLLLLILMGVARFVVGLSGVPYDRATDLLSVTILVFVLAAIYGQRVPALSFGSIRHLVPIALALTLVMYGVILAAILAEGLLGLHGWFHSPGSGYAPAEMALRDHVLGQLSVMWIMGLAILGVTILGYATSRHLALLARPIVVLGVVALVRFVAGPLGLPESVFTWLTSLTVAGAGVAVYAGYRAPGKGLDRIVDSLVLTFLLVFVVTHLAAYGIAVTEGLGFPTYFHTPGEMTKRDHIAAHLLRSPWLAIAAFALITAGTFVGRRTANASDGDVSVAPSAT